MSLGLWLLLGAQDSPAIPEAASQAGRQAASSPWMQGATRVFRAERSQRISSERRRAGVVKRPLGTMESQRSPFGYLAGVPI